MMIKFEFFVLLNENQEYLEEDFYEEVDPRKPLLKWLLEYKQIKEIIPKFEERPSDRAEYFGKDPTDISEYSQAIELKDQGLDISDLSTIFLEVLQRHELQTPQPTTIETDEIGRASCRERV